MSLAISHAVSIDREPLSFDPWLIGVVMSLLALGLVMVYSATVASSGITTSPNLQQVKQHSAHLVLALGAMAATSRAPLKWWSVASMPLLGFVVLLLIIVAVPGIGIEVNGSRRWLPVGTARMQPSELAKLAMIIYAAAYLARKQELLNQFRHGILIIGGVTAVVAVLLLLEPDFGSLVVIVVTVITMLFLAGVRISHFLLCAAVGGASMVLLTVVSPYRMQRVMSFLNPWSDPYDSGFQLSQALIAFGRGEWFGAGLGSSIQKLFYLPHASNDFLLAVIAEELGLIGVVAVVTAFGVLLWRAFVAARRAERTGNLFAARLAQGIGLLLAYEAMINMGVNMGVLPTKGLTLPFLSYGGSSLVASCAAVGLLIATHSAARPKPRGAR